MDVSGASEPAFPVASSWSSVSTGDASASAPRRVHGPALGRARRSRSPAPTRTRSSFSSAVGSTMIGLRFAPGFAPRVLGVPADAFTDQRVPLDAVWASGASPPAHRSALGEQLAGARAGDRFARPLPPTRRERRARRARRRSSPAPVHNSTTIADRIGLSTRQLQRTQRRRVRLRREDARPDPPHAARAHTRAPRRCVSPIPRRASATPTSRTSPVTSRRWPA